VHSLINLALLHPHAIKKSLSLVCCHVLAVFLCLIYSSFLPLISQGQPDQWMACAPSRPLASSLHHDRQYSTSVSGFSDESDTGFDDPAKTSSVDVHHQVQTHERHRSVQLPYRARGNDKEKGYIRDSAISTSKISQNKSGALPSMNAGACTHVLIALCFDSTSRKESLPFIHSLEYRFKIEYFFLIIVLYEYI
jgi:hypothetical protein